MIFGINATKEAIFIAEVDESGEQFIVRKVRRIKFQIEKANDLVDLLQSISTVFDHPDSNTVSVAVLKCSGGQYGSSIDAIKAEAIVELAAVQRGLPVLGISPQSLKKALGCSVGEKWQDRSKQMFNANGEHSYWSQGANGAVAAAYKAAA